MIPKFKIRADILMYIIVLGGGTAGAFAFSEVNGVSEEEKLKTLKEKYPVQIKYNEDQRQQLQAFFDQMKEGNSPEMDKQFNTILRSGKNDIKRQHRYDEQDILKTKTKEASNVIASEEKDKANVVPTSTETESSVQSKSVWNLWGWWG